MTPWRFEGASNPNRRKFSIVPVAVEIISQALRRVRRQREAQQRLAARRRLT
jgi:hypothetical protein